MFVDQKEYSKLLRRERAPSNIYFHTGNVDIFWHFSAEAVTLCEREDRQDFVKHS